MRIIIWQPFRADEFLGEKDVIKRAAFLIMGFDANISRRLLVQGKIATASADNRCQSLGAATVGARVAKFGVRVMGVIVLFEGSAKRQAAKKTLFSLLAAVTGTIGRPNRERCKVLTLAVGTIGGRAVGSASAT